MLGQGLNAQELAAELTRALADRPRLVFCDLSGMAMAAVELGKLFGSLADHLIGWPGVVVVVVSTDPDVRSRVRALPPAYRLVVADSRQAGEVAAISLLSSLRGAELTLAPDLGSPRAARVFAAQAMLDWDLPSLVAPACLVVSELVTNSVVHAATSVQLILSRMDGRVLVAVRDQADGVPDLKSLRADEDQDGRGLMLVQAFALEWGVVPAESGGKTVWALLGAESGEPGPRLSEGAAV